MAEKTKEVLLEHLGWANEELERVVSELQLAAKRVDFARGQVVRAAEMYVAAKEREEGK